MSPAEELRAAAARLREMAKDTTPGPWGIADCELYPRWILGEPEGDSPYAADVAKSYADGGGDGVDVSDADWAWMAFAHPGWAEPLAALLEAVADSLEQAASAPFHRRCIQAVACEPYGIKPWDTDTALAVARVINGPAGGEG